MTEDGLLKGKNYILVIALIFVFAIAVRVHNLRWENLAYGEVEVYQSASDYAKGKIVNSFYIFDTPPFGKYVYAISYSLINDLELAARVVSVVFGVLVIAALYFFAEKLYDKETAIIAAALSAVSIIQIQFSRDGRLDGMLTLFSLMALLFTWNLIKKKDRASYVLLGFFVALGMLTKFDMILTIISIIIIFWRSRNISIGARKGFNLCINSNLLKALAVSIAVFFLLWPFSLMTMETSVKIDVSGHGVDIKSDIPILLLSLGKRFASVTDHGQQLPIPKFSYLETLFLKESLLFGVLIITGLYFMIFRTRSEQDIFILIFLAVTMLAFSLTSYNFTYRHLLVVMPFFAVVAARSFNMIKKEHYRRLAAVTAVTILGAVAIMSGPSYPLYYNELKQFSGIPESEGRFSEGSRELAATLDERCQSFYGEPLYIFMLDAYGYKPSVDKPECYFFNEFSSDLTKSYVTENNCSHLKTIKKQDTVLIFVYTCRY